MNGKLLRFLVATNSGFNFGLMERYHPGGHLVLNSTEWRGYAPRTCGVTRVHGNSREGTPLRVHVDVEYRPPGYISYVGNTKYDGWACLMLDRAKDGTLLDGKGQPLETGKPPVWLRFDVYKDADFNEMDFGEFEGDEDLPSVAHVTFAKLMEEFQESGKFNGSMDSDFVAPRRQRPDAKIMLTSMDTGIMQGSGGTHLINVNANEPHLEDVIMRHLTDVVYGYMEGRFTVPTISGADPSVIFIDLSRILVDCTPNERGGETLFGVLDKYTPAGFLEDLARKVSAVFTVEASVVEGSSTGLVLRRQS